MICAIFQKRNNQEIMKDKKNPSGKKILSGRIMYFVQYQYLFID